MKIGIVGAGYVGLTAASSLSSHYRVVCVDIDEERVARLKKGECPIYEPGLDVLMRENLAAERLHFTTNLKDLAENSQVIMLCVGTPTRSGADSADLSAVFQVARGLAPHLKAGTIVVNKSTAPVGTCERIQRILAEGAEVPFEVASNPEFLREGCALENFLHPDRVVVGASSADAAGTLVKLYEPYGAPVVTMSPRAAELTKYACNAYLAMRLSFINDVANLCEAVGADVQDVSQAMGLDPRIGSHYLSPGIGYGGACFPKDTRALMATGREYGHSLELVNSTQRINDAQKLVLVRKVRRQFGGELFGRRIALWGVAFKPHTDDIREAPSLLIAEHLILDGAQVTIYDPEVTEFVEAMGVMGGAVEVASDMYEATKGADALLLCTEWPQFAKPDIGRLKESLAQPIVFDGRNLWSRSEFEAEGFSYAGVGR